MNNTLKTMLVAAAALTAVSAQAQDKATLDLLTDTARREALQADLASVVATLGSGGAYARAAQAVHQALRQ